MSLGIKVVFSQNIIKFQGDPMDKCCSDLIGRYHFFSQPQSVLCFHYKIFIWRVVIYNTDHGLEKERT